MTTRGGMRWGGGEKGEASHARRKRSERQNDIKGREDLDDGDGYYVNYKGGRVVSGAHAGFHFQHVKRDLQGTDRPEVSSCCLFILCRGRTT